MSIPAQQYMLDELLRRKFRYDKFFALKNNLCTCPEYSQAEVREMKLFEIDIPTPAQKHFEEFLDEFGFGLPTEKIKSNKYLFLINLIYKLIDKMLAVVFGINTKYRHNPKGTDFRNFEIPKDFKGTFGFNCRNFILGRMIEFPVGSYDVNVKCPVCQKGTCQD
jgi:hypothetical protein